MKRRTERDRAAGPFSAYQFFIISGVQAARRTDTPDILSGKRFSRRYVFHGVDTPAEGIALCFFGGRSVGNASGRAAVPKRLLCVPHSLHHLRELIFGKRKRAVYSIVLP